MTTTNSQNRSPTIPLVQHALISNSNLYDQNCQLLVGVNRQGDGGKVKKSGESDDIENKSNNGHEDMAENYNGYDGDGDDDDDDDGYGGYYSRKFKQDEEIITEKNSSPQNGQNGIKKSYHSCSFYQMTHPGGKLSKSAELLTSYENNINKLIKMSYTMHMLPPTTKVNVDTDVAQ
jgi:hypothetical protein